MITGTSIHLTSLCCDTTDVEHIEQFSAFSMLNRTAIAVSRIMRWKFFHNLLKIMEFFRIVGRCLTTVLNITWPRNI